MAQVSTKTSDLVITRVFNAPRDRVWKAWTDSESYRKWWGPAGFTSPVSRIDLRVGGKYLSCMRAPDGRDYWSTGVYREIVPPERLVYTDSFADEQGNVVPASHYGMGEDFPPEMLVTVTFEEEKGKTKMTLRHAGMPEGKHQDMAREGWNGSFDKLEVSITGSGLTAIVAEPGGQEVVMTRVFDAPRKLVFKAYTDAALLAKWWGPRRFTTIVDKMELRPGGIWRYINREAGKGEYAFHGVFHEISSPESIVCTFEFEGMPGHVQLDTATFEETGGRTTLTTHAVFQSVADRDGELLAGMKEGFSESMDRLAELLETLKKTERKAA